MLVLPGRARPGMHRWAWISERGGKVRPMTQTARRNPLGFIEAEIDDLKAKQLYRPLRVMSAAQGPTTVVDGREVISLSSNDYLGLTHHPRLREAALKAVAEYGVGSGAVRTIAGTMDLHEELERD